MSGVGPTSECSKSYKLTLISKPHLNTQTHKSIFITTDNTTSPGSASERTT
nr:MAG TPA: hypothetical protein [Caudoviricetes sp.]